MDVYTQLCAEIAGGFSTIGSPCIVNVTSLEHSTTKTTQVQSVEPAGQPEDMLKRLSDIIDMGGDIHNFVEGLKDVPDEQLKLYKSAMFNSQLTGGDVN